VKKLIATSLVMAAASGLLFAADTAAAPETEAQFIQRTYLAPHHSKIDANMVLSLRDWYGIPPLWTLTIAGAESSVGDPKLGGRLVGFNNFFCIRFGDHTTKWGSLSVDNTPLHKPLPAVTVGGRKWFQFPSAWSGMVAWGRLIKVGPACAPGYYMDCIRKNDLESFAEMYYGRDVPGFAAYLDNVHRIWNSFQGKANAAGYDW